MLLYDHITFRWLPLVPPEVPDGSRWCPGTVAGCFWSVTASRETPHTFLVIPGSPSSKPREAGKKHSESVNIELISSDRDARSPAHSDHHYATSVSTPQAAADALMSSLSLLGRRQKLLEAYDGR